MRHFNFFENGGPFPSACVSCGNNNKLFDLGRELMGGGMTQLCLTCATEIAEFIGFAEAAPMKAKIASLEADIVSRETELAKVPSKVEDLINGIRSSVTDFIFAVSYSDDTHQPEVVSKSKLTTNSDSDHRASAPRNAQTPSKSARH
jgi:hypothetical protein